LILDDRMRYMYLTQYRTVSEDEIRDTKDNDPGLEVRHVETLEEIANADYSNLVKVFPPLARVTEYARVVAFLRWLRDNPTTVITDFTDIIGVKVRDPFATPTIDQVTH